MPKVTNEVKAEKIRLAQQMRKDDVGWDQIAKHADINTPVVTLQKWLGETTNASRPSRPKRGAKNDLAAELKELRAENARLQALVSDILLGKVKVQRA